MNTMKCVSVGEAGVWGVKAKDESVWVRSYSQDGKAAGKVPMDKDAGADWMKLQVRTVYAWNLDKRSSYENRTPPSPSPSSESITSLSKRPFFGRGYGGFCSNLETRQFDQRRFSFRARYLFSSSPQKPTNHFYLAASKYDDVSRSRCNLMSHMCLTQEEEEIRRSMARRRRRRKSFSSLQLRGAPTDQGMEAKVPGFRIN